MNWKNYKSYTYGEYMDMMENYADTYTTSGNDQSDSHKRFTKINYARMKRLNKQAAIRPELKEAVIKAPAQTWYIITESWCGDAAQNVPYIAAMALLNSNIEVRLIFRDQYPELIKKYHTNGAYSIPKLISIDKNGDELFVWGPRPESIQKWYIPKLKEAEDKKPVQQELHTLYAHNKGEDIQADFIERLT
ncbi:thioredoxin family protein [bacterium]|nr:thioredoxin family protein [bacterium]